MKINAKTNILITAAIALVAAIGLIVSMNPLSVSAQPAFRNELCGGANLSLSESPRCGDNFGAAEESSLNNLIENIVNIISIIIGIIAVIMIIVGGFKFITSGGDSAKVVSARNTVLYAIVGLIIVALAQLIVRFVLSQT